MAPLSLDITATAGKQFVPFLRKHLPRAHRISESPLRELSIVLVGDKDMADLHERFMRIAGPTDVLTFPLDHASGEVVICVPEARRRAKAHDIPVQKELLLYALHGLLHLSGYDDRTDRDFTRMHQKEDQILKQLGVGEVFARGERRPRRNNTAGTRRRLSGERSIAGRGGRR